MSGLVPITFVTYGTDAVGATVVRMPLTSMVVSRDWQEVSVLECILGGLKMNVTVEQEPQQAMTRLSKSRFDALIVDCDLNGSWQFIRELSGLETEAKPVPLVLMGGAQRVQELETTGALFAFEKPISVEEAVRTLSATRNLIVDGRLRYHRAGIEVLVSVRSKGRNAVPATLVNLSQGGMQIHTEFAIEPPNTVEISFALPGSKPELKAQAEVVWKDQQGNVGVRFVRLTPPQQRALQVWLAQQFLAN